MPDAGFLGSPGAVEQPKNVEVPQTQVEGDEYSAAEREARQEMAAEQNKETFLETAGEAAPTTTVVPQNDAAQQGQAEPAAVVKDDVTLEVEKILEDGLGEYVPDMPEEARERFLKKGGEVAGQLTVMVRSLDVNVKLVLDLIKEWLLTIPGVNRYFVEQESKIKTDKIAELTNAHRGEMKP